MLKDFRTYLLAVRFYRLVMVQNLPRHLRDQLARAASSIALNLAEGYGRTSPDDKRKSYVIAFGSLRECQAIIEVAGIRRPELWDLTDHLGACLYKLTSRKAA